MFLNSLGCSATASVLLLTLIALSSPAVRVTAQHEGHDVSPAVPWQDGQVLTPPVDVKAHCYAETFGEFTRRFPICSKLMLNGKEPGTS